MLKLYNNVNFRIYLNIFSDFTAGKKKKKKKKKGVNGQGKRERDGACGTPDALGRVRPQPYTGEEQFDRVRRVSVAQHSE